MRTLLSIILRLFVGLFLGICLFYLGSFFLLDSGADSKLGIASVIFLPFIFAFLASWIFFDMISLSRYRNRWMKIASGEIETEEYEWQHLVKKGLRELLGPLTVPGKGYKRAGEYSYAWALSLLQMRMKESWCWELYNINWAKISDHKPELTRLKQLILESDFLTDEAFRLGLKLYETLDQSKDLINVLAQEGIKREEGKLLPGEMETLEEIWIKASSGESKIKEKLIPKLTKCFLAIKRRDEVAGKIYLLALKNKICPYGMKEEMYIVSYLLNQLGRSEKLAEKLSQYGKKPAREFFVEDIISEDFPPDEEQVDTDIGEIPAQELHDLYDPEDKGEERVDEYQKGFHTADIWNKISDLSKIFGVWLLDSGKQLLHVVKYAYNRGKHLRPHHYIAAVSVIIIIFVLAATIPRKSSLFNGDRGLSHPGPVLSDQPFTIQVAAYKLQDTAVQQLNKLRIKNIDAYLVYPAENKSSYYQLRFGHYNTIQEANTAADSFKTSGIIEEYFIARFEEGEVPVGVE